VRRRTLLAGAVLAIGLVFAAAGGARGLSRTRAAVSLRVTYAAGSGPTSLTYTVRCEPASGTIARPAAACAAIAREPGMIPGASAKPPASCSPAGAGVEVQPPRSFSVAVAGTYHGKSVEQGVCFEERAWLRFLPSQEALDRVRVDRGVGVVSLGQSESSVRALLGPPHERRQGLQIYRSGAVEQVTLGVPVIFAVGYGPTGRVSTVIDNSLDQRIGRERPTVTPSGRSSLHGWLRVDCGGHEVLADHRPIDGRATTIISPPVASIPTVIVSNAPAAACVAAARTAPAPLPLG